MKDKSVFFCSANVILSLAIANDEILAFKITFMHFFNTFKQCEF